MFSLFHYFCRDEERCIFYIINIVNSDDDNNSNNNSNNNNAVATTTTTAAATTTNIINIIISNNNNKKNKNNRQVCKSIMFFLSTRVAYGGKNLLRKGDFRSPFMLHKLPSLTNLICYQRSKAVLQSRDKSDCDFLFVSEQNGEKLASGGVFCCCVC